MDSVFEQFLRKAKKMGLCKEYTDKVDNAGSKAAFLQIALDANGMSWLCDSICRGWGLSAEYIAEEFKPFNNGAFVRRKDGYTSAMYCNTEAEEIKITTTAVLIIGYKGTVIVNRPCQLYLCNSDVVITGTERPDVYLYNSSVINDVFVTVKGNIWY